jgi:putative ABC transport system substrate-binding protein
MRLREPGRETGLFLLNTPWSQKPLKRADLEQLAIGPAFVNFCISSLYLSERLPMKRRQFLALLGGASLSSTTGSTPGRAQSQVPVIGFLHSASLEPNRKRLEGFRRGLRKAGLVEGENVAIEFRWADGQNAQLPQLAAELARKPVNIIVTLSSTPATLAAKAATASVPIVFLIAEDPVELGLAASLNRPGGNATGISSQNAELVAKRLGLLREIAPRTTEFAVLLNPNSPSARQVSGTLQAAAVSLGVKLSELKAGSEAEIEAAYRSLNPGSALLVSTNPFLFSRRAQLVALSNRHAVPTMYDNRESAEAGGLMSYGQNTEISWDQAGMIVGRILKGERPGDLPVAQPTRFDFVINLKTARALGLDVAPSLVARADDVIE